MAAMKKSAKKGKAAKKGGAKRAATKKAARRPAARKTAVKAKKAAPKKAAKKAPKKAAKKATAKKATKKRVPNAAFMKPMQPTAQLAAVIGDKPMPRSEVTKKVWAYIKSKGLQDSKNRRNINADDKLGPVFGGKKQVSMFEMTKLVNKHLKG
jgi:chromatin remodeling complex protein RSC6